MANLEEIYREGIRRYTGYKRIDNLKAELKSRREDLVTWEENFDHANISGIDYAGNRDYSTFNALREVHTSMIKFFMKELQDIELEWYEHLRGTKSTS